VSTLSGLPDTGGTRLAAAADGTAGARPRAWVLHRTVALLAIAHLAVDGYTNIYAPLLPLLIPRLGMSLQAAGALAMLFQMAASVSQLAFGWLADRWHPRRLLVLGPLLTVGTLSFIGWAPNLWVLGLLLVAGGLGSAAFHPPAATLAHKLGGARPGLSMSVYITGGTIGFALGPLTFAPIAERFGLVWTPLLALPGLALVFIFVRRIPPVTLATSHRPASWSALRPYTKPLFLLWLIVVLRTVTSMAFATFVPVMLTRRGLGVGMAAAAVSAYLLASGLGGFLGGPAGDRFGARRVIAWSLVAAAPFMIVAPMLDGLAFAVVLAIGGFFLQSTLPVNVTFAQTIAPVSAATVSSLMMGVAWGTGGLTVPLVGRLADGFGIEPVLIALAFLPLLGALCTIPLPGRQGTG